jgi:twitching motility protein PilI
LSLKDLISEPFELLLELERRAKAAIASEHDADADAEAWTGIGFRLGDEEFVAARGDVREILPVPEQLTRVPGCKPWLRGIANVRGQLMTLVDLKSFLGDGRTVLSRRSRALHLTSREQPTAVIVDEVLGFRRFAESEHNETPPATRIRCERYLAGAYTRGTDTWPLFSFERLVEDDQFLNAGEKAVA